MQPAMLGWQGMEEQLTLKRLAEIRGRVNSREANAVTDADADWTPVHTPLLRQILAAAEKGLQAEELAQVGRTIAYFVDKHRLPLDADTKRELDAALAPFAKEAPSPQAVEELVPTI